MSEKRSRGRAALRAEGRSALRAEGLARLERRIKKLEQASNGRMIRFQLLHLALDVQFNRVGMRFRKEPVHGDLLVTASLIENLSSAEDNKAVEALRPQVLAHYRKLLRLKEFPWMLAVARKLSNHYGFIAFSREDMNVSEADIDASEDDEQ